MSSISFLSDLSFLSDICPELAVLGGILSIVKMFLPQQTPMIVKVYKALAAEISEVGQVIMSEISAAFAALELTEVETQYTNAINDVMVNYQNMINFNSAAQAGNSEEMDMYANHITNSCNNDACQENLQLLINAINGGGQFSKPLLPALVTATNGNTAKLRQASQYIIGVAGHALAIYSWDQGYKYGQAGYTSVQSQYGASMKTAVQTVQTVFYTAVNAAPGYIGTVTESYEEQHASLSNEDFAQGLVSLLQSTYDLMSFTVISYDQNDGFQVDTAWGYNDYMKLRTFNRNLCVWWAGQQCSYTTVDFSTVASTTNSNSNCYNICQDLVPHGSLQQCHCIADSAAPAYKSYMPDGQVDFYNNGKYFVMAAQWTNWNACYFRFSSESEFNSWVSTI